MITYTDFDFSPLLMPKPKPWKWMCIFPLFHFIQPLLRTRFLAKGGVTVCVSWTASFKMSQQRFGWFLPLQKSWFVLLSTHRILVVHFLWFSGRVNTMKGKTASTDVLIAVTWTLWQQIETNERDYIPRKSVNSLCRCHRTLWNVKTENQTLVRSLLWF